MLRQCFRRMMEVNVRAPFQISQMVAKRMVERNSGGSIVNISSQASLRALKDHSIYCASKAALDSMTKAMSLELGKHNIRVNAVNPTVVNTAMSLVGWSDPQKANAMKAAIPLGRFADVNEVVTVVLFLLSDGASMVTGSCIPIDGGCVSCLAV